MNKKIILSLVIASFLLIGGVSAGLLSYYGKINSITEVEHPLDLKVVEGSDGINILNDEEFKIDSERAYEEHTINFSLENDANVDVETIIVFFISSGDYDFSEEDAEEKFEKYLVKANLSEDKCNSLTEYDDAVIWNNTDEKCYIDGTMIPPADITERPVGEPRQGYMVPLGLVDGNPPVNGTIIESGETINIEMNIQFELNTYPGKYGFEIVPINPSMI